MSLALLAGSFDDFVTSEIYRWVFFAALAAIVIITAKLGRVRKGPTTTVFPPALGVRLVLAAGIGIFALMIFCAFDVGWGWIADLFLLGPLYLLWSWPATIAVDELSIRAIAILRSEVRINWSEVVSVTSSAAGDALIAKAHSGEKIKVPNTQVGADELVSIIREKTGIACTIPSLTV